MMRVVLDSNILARPAMSTMGPAAEVLDRMQQSVHVLISSSFILAELDRILRYPRLRRLHNFDDAQIARYVSDVRDVAIIVDPTADEVVPIVKNDPDDDHIIATAVIGKAEAICTWDTDFNTQDVRDYCAQNVIEIIDDVELLQRMRQLESGNADNP